MVFGKPATPGRVKTRLAATLGDREAARGYEAFFCDVVEMARRFCDQQGWSLSLAWPDEGGDRLARFGVETCDAELVDQGQGDLGARMKGVVEHYFEAGEERVLIIGSDSPTLGVEHLKRAADQLEDHHVVFGPSFDGGYYLVGCRRGSHDWGALFRDIPWSTARVMEETVARVEEAGLLYELTEFWYDIDTFEDLKLARFHLLRYIGKQRPGRARRSRQWLAELDDKK